MKSAPHLLNEDRQDYERLLDDALRSAPHRQELAAVGQRFNAEQLRTMALSATALITAAAAAEYVHYVRIREELRAPARITRPLREGRAPQQQAAGVVTGTGTGTGAMGLATPAGQVTEPAGAGLVAVVAVLAPLLAGTAAAIFLLVGYLLKMLDPEPAFARTLLTTGWVFGGITAAAILVAAVGLLLTALRNASTSLRVDQHAELDEAVERARDAWHEALLEQGIVPFLRDALADPAGAGTDRTKGRDASHRIPQLGYHRPGFTSPDGGPEAGPRPSYSSPDFSSPDFGGPDHRPD